MSNRINTRVIVAALTLLAIFGCGEPEQRPAPDKVALQLKWIHQAQFAGFYLAREKGFYADENLEIELLEGGKGVDITEALLSGAADFAVLAPEDLLVKRKQGAAITAIAAIYRRSAVVFATQEGAGIDKPSDFIGRTAAVGGGTGAIRDFEIQFNALTKRLGLDLQRIGVVDYDPSYEGFLRGAVDITPAYTTGGVVRMKLGGHRLHLIWPGDYGIRFYSDILVAADRTVEEKPDVVTRFLRATLRGWREAVGDPSAAVAATLKYAHIPDEALQSAMMEALMPLVHTGEDRIGWMSAARWSEMLRILSEQGILSPPAPAVDDVHTMRFLKAVYGGPS